MNKIGRTMWIQPGQMDFRLHAVSLEVSNELAIEHVKHSIFGESQI